MPSAHGPVPLGPSPASEAAAPNSNVGCRPSSPWRRPPLPATDGARAREGARAVTALTNLVADLLIGAVTGLVDIALRGFARSKPQSHGSSRWAGCWDRRSLGRRSRPELAARDGVALGFLGPRPLPSP